MDNGYSIIPEHIRENLKIYSPNITETIFYAWNVATRVRWALLSRRAGISGLFLTSGGI